MEDIIAFDSKRLAVLLWQKHQILIQKTLVACSLDHLRKHRLRVRRFNKNASKVLTLIETSLNSYDRYKMIWNLRLYHKKRKYTIKWFTVNGQLAYEDKYSMARELAHIHRKIHFYTYDEDDYIRDNPNLPVDAYKVFIKPTDDLLLVFHSVVNIFQQFETDEIYNFRMYFVIKKVQKHHVLFLKCAWHIFPQTIQHIRNQFNRFEFNSIFCTSTFVKLLENMDSTGLRFHPQPIEDFESMTHYLFTISFEEVHCYTYFFHCLKSTLCVKKGEFFVKGYIPQLFNFLVRDVLIVQNRVFYIFTWSTINCEPVVEFPTKPQFSEALNWIS